MAYKNEQVQDLFNDAADQDLSVMVRSDGIVDYRGVNMSKALDAVLAVEEADVYFFLDGEEIGWALILPDLDEGEQIADCSGWVARNIPA